MVLRKITLDNSGRYIPKTEQTKERHIKPKTIKAGFFLVNKTETFHKTIQDSLNTLQQKDSVSLNE